MADTLERGIATAAQPSLAGRLDTKVALVSGASRNMGRGVAEALAARGATVVFHFHSSETQAGAEEAAAGVQAAGGAAAAEQADLTNVAEVAALFDRVVGRFGRLDIFVNTAGVMLKKPLVEVTESEYDRMFDVHTRAAFFCMREAAKRIENGGRIVNISTSLTAVTTGLYSVYAGAKSAVEQFTKNLAKEIGDRGVTVNAIAPGPINTSFFYPVESDESIAFLKSMSVAGRLGELDEIVPAIAFLCSPEAHWITAQTIRVNGGMV